MSVNVNSQNWNSNKLINLSKNLGEGYNLGLNNVNAKSNKKADSWNACKFIEMSRSLSSAYGVDFEINTMNKNTKLYVRCQRARVAIAVSQPMYDSEVLTNLN